MRALDQDARRFEFIVTFNGKSYDAPVPEDRAVVHGVSLELPATARRSSPSRAAQMEGRCCPTAGSRRSRATCAAGAAGVTCRATRFRASTTTAVRRGDPYRLIPVFHHNMLDVITMGEVLHALCAPRELAVEEEVEAPGTYEGGSWGDVRSRRLRPDL